MQLINDLCLYGLLLRHTPLLVHTCSIFLPTGRALSVCLCWSLLPSKCAKYHPNAFTVACRSYHCWIIGTCYSDFLKYSTIATPRPYAYTQLSRCDAGVLSCVSLLPDLLCHLSYHHAVHHFQCGKLITVACHLTFILSHGIYCTDSCSNIQQLLWCSEAEVQESFTTQAVTAFYVMSPRIIVQAQTWVTN